MEYVEDLSKLSPRELKTYFESVKVEISKEDMYQNAMKILINSLYGALGEASFRYYDPDMAEAITATGQVMIRYITRKMNEFLNKLLSTEKDYVVSSDTDAIYTIFSGFIDIILQKKPNLSQDEIANLLDKFCKQTVEPFLGKSFEEMADYLNSRENMMYMKREAIASSIVIRAKKNYAMDVLDNEGVRFAHPKLKVTGLESVRTTLPVMCREALEECYKMILRDSNDKSLIEFVVKFKAAFMEAPIVDICGNTGIKGIENYIETDPRKKSDKNNPYEWMKGTPYHVKAALTFNRFLHENQITHVKPIENYAKIKIAELKEGNPYGNETIAFEEYMPELQLEKWTDKVNLFNKYFISPLESMTKLINWDTERKVNLDDYF